jgi:DNA-binding response OmpR family regulator
MSKRILVADDHAPTRSLVRAILDETKAFDIVEAETGRECLLRVQEGSLDLVLLDVGLPDLDGFSVCRQIRAVAPRLPVVFVTARGEMEDMAAARAAGADSYIVKPIARRSLRSIVSLFTNAPAPR